MSERFASFDGVELAFRRVGAGRPVVLLHGLFSSAEVNWIKFGHAQKLADAGFEAIMPDLRAHGQSAAPHDPASYPPEVLVRDLEALVAHLGLETFDLAGFSLGARTVARAVAGGMAPRRLVIAGMGLGGLTDWAARPTFFLDAIARFDEIRMGDEAYFTVQFMKTMKIDRVAAKLLLEAVGKGGPVELARIAMPTLVVCGEQDRDNGSPEALAAALPDGHYAAVPGTHMSSVTKPEMGEAIARFLVE
ncbi:MAG: alpha/beta fold hydrolase [Novosphingobium sp.]|nr:alpha/beta fold hydrolase [Novosphingobium sp.]MBO9603113.1 alpha/beta fold hydrolase [Novosphingobium sp.]